MKLQRLLVVIDPSQQEQPALQRAVWLARQTGASLELLLCEYQSALEHGGLFSADASDQARTALLQERQEWLETLAAPLRSAGLLVQLSLRWGKPLDQQVLAHVAANPPDLLFKAARNHGLFRRLFLSNSCWQLIRNCPVPVWLVHHGEWSGHNRLCAALDPLHSADKPAALEHQLLSASRELSVQLGLEPYYLHCYEPLPRTLVFDSALIADYTEYEQQCYEQHRQAFADLLAPYAIAHHNSHLIKGYAEAVIPTFIREHAIDLLLMGAVSRGHIETALIGNTAERVLEEVDCDLLVFNSGAKGSAEEA